MDEPQREDADLYRELGNRVGRALRDLESSLNLLDEETGLDQLHVARYESVRTPLEQAVLSSRAAREVLREWDGELDLRVKTKRQLPADPPSAPQGS